jgi:hypothetical protein
MSTPDTPTTATATPSYPEPTPADADALFASVVWLDWKAQPELLKQYEGKHIAIFGEQIIDADSDKEALFRRLNANEALPPYRVLVRYIPTDEEAWSGCW